MDRNKAFAVTQTTLEELARAIYELVSSDGSAPMSRRQLRAEMKAAEEVFRQRAALIDIHVSDRLCQLTVTLLLEAMLRQVVETTLPPYR